MPIVVAALARHTEWLPLLARWMRDEWPQWYGAGGRGDAAADLQFFAAGESALPIGLIAFRDKTPVGMAALKAQSLPSHAHLGPWAAAGLVVPALRGQGIGAQLLDALVSQACRLGFAQIYCATATAASLLRRGHWSQREVAVHDGESLTIFAKDTA
ncbi:MAG: GNAT family N-acetyltransferase [Burkholderiaceae bacterium]